MGNDAPLPQYARTVQNDRFLTIARLENHSGHLNHSRSSWFDSNKFWMAYMEFFRIWVSTLTKKETV